MQLYTPYKLIQSCQYSHEPTDLQCRCFTECYIMLLEIEFPEGAWAPFYTYFVIVIECI